MIKMNIFPHRSSVVLGLHFADDITVDSWWCHQCIMWYNNFDVYTWKMISDLLDMDFIHGHIHGQLCKKPQLAIHEERQSMGQTQTSQWHPISWPVRKGRAWVKLRPLNDIPYPGLWEKAEHGSNSDLSMTSHILACEKRQSMGQTQTSQWHPISWPVRKGRAWVKLRPLNDIPYPGLTGQLFSVYCECFRKSWASNNKTPPYYELYCKQQW